MDQATDTRAQYGVLVRQLLDAWHAGHGTTEQHVRLHAFRQLVHQKGRGAALAAVWVDPPASLDAAGRAWFAAEVSHRLFGGPAAGPRPQQRNEHDHYREKRRPLVPARLVLGAA